MTDLTTAADLATAGGTLVLAIATFASIRAGQRSTKLAERSLLAGLRPLLFPTRLDDPPEKVGFQDQHFLRVEGGRAVVDVTDDVIYLAMSIRNVGSGMAVLDRWCLRPSEESRADAPAPLEQFRRLTRDLYVPPNDRFFWQGALREPDDPVFVRTAKQVAASDPIVLELLYGDIEGGQRTISRFSFTVPTDRGWLVALSRHWYLDNDAPR